MQECIEDMLGNKLLKMDVIVLFSIAGTVENNKTVFFLFFFFKFFLLSIFHAGVWL